MRTSSLVPSVPHVVVADDDLPVGAPAVPADHDRGAAGEGGLHPGGVEQGVGVIVARLKVPAPGDARRRKVLEDADQLRERGEAAPPLVGLPEGDHVLLVQVAAQAEPVEGAQRRRHTAGASGDLQGGPVARQHGERATRRRVVVVDEGPVGLVRQVREVGDAAPVADAVAGELALAHGDPVLAAVERLAGGVVHGRIRALADAGEPGHVRIPVDGAQLPGDDQDAVDDGIPVLVPQLHVLADQAGAGGQGPHAPEGPLDRVGDAVDLGCGRHRAHVHLVAVDVAQQGERPQALAPTS